MAELTPAQQLGRRIRAERATRGWSLEQLAVKTSSSRMTVWRIEHGRDITYSTATRIAAALGISLDSPAAGQP